MRSLLKEPLVHFLLLGAALFAIHGLLNRAPTAKPEEIVVSAGQIEHLSATFARFQQRPPTAAELQGSIDQYVREEILSREAVMLGLDQHDTVIRRRLQQKMEFVATDLATEEPTEDELAGWLQAHPENYRQEPRFSFQHVYLNPDKHGDHLDADLSKLLADLNHVSAPADVATKGDTFLLPHEFTEAPHSEVAEQFGPDFASQLSTMKAGEWAGPIRSGYGVHVVLLTALTASRLPALDEVHGQVRRDLINERRIDANRRFLDALFAKYTVTIEWPSSDPITADQTLAKIP